MAINSSLTTIPRINSTPSLFKAPRPATAIPILMGFVHVYPEAGSILSLGAFALRLWSIQ